MKDTKCGCCGFVNPIGGLTLVPDPTVENTKILSCLICKNSGFKELIFDPNTPTYLYKIVRALAWSQNHILKQLVNK
jgi:hypothetical protein